MLLFTCVLGCCLLILFEFHFFKDFKTPTFMYGFIWLIVYLFLLLQNYDFIQYNPLLLSFLGAFFFFFCGFYLVCNRIPYSAQFFPIQFDLEWNPSTKKIIFLIEYILSIIVFTYCRSVISISQFSAWQAVRHGMSEEGLFPTWIGIMFQPVRIIFFVSYALFLYTPNKGNRIALLMSVPPIILTSLFTSRGDWFLIIITLVYISFFIKRSSNKAIALFGLFSFLGILLIFIISSFDKFTNVYINGAQVDMNEIEKIKWIFSGYFVGPIFNFFDWFRNAPDYACGLYTFRLVCALLAPLFPDIEVVKTVLEFRTVNGISSNVYTSLNWLARDFGIWWALIVQFFLGIFYGTLYKRCISRESPHIIAIITLSMFMMPIVNQFFDDKIFSVLSIWLQRIIALYIIVKTSVLVKRKYM